MTFYINLTDGTSLATVADGTIDTTDASITLIGKNFPTYGQLLNQNLISMLENFANVTSPNYPLVGQLWYDRTNNVLKYYRAGAASNYWQNLTNIIYSSTTPTVAQQNDVWWDSSNQQLKYYDQLNWITIGPQTTNDGLNRVSGTNSFIVQIGGNNVFTVDAYGRVNAAYNPVVQVSGLNGGSVYNGGGLLSPQPFIPTTVTINVGSYFNATTGVFTAPVAGIYQVSASIVSLGSTNSTSTTQEIIWWKNQSDTGISSRARHVNSSYNSETIITPMTAAGYIQCIVGDTIQAIFAAEQNGQIDYQNSSLSIRLVS